MPRKPVSLVVPTLIATLAIGSAGGRVARADDAGPTVFQRAISSWMGVVTLLAADGDGDRKDGADGRGGREGRERSERRGREGRDGQSCDCKGAGCEKCKAAHQAGGAKDHDCKGGDCEHCRQHRDGDKKAEPRATANEPRHMGPGRGPGGPHAAMGPGRGGDRGPGPWGPGPRMHAPPPGVPPVHAVPGMGAPGQRPDSTAKLDEIVDRLARIERKLDAAPRMGNPWSPRSEAGRGPSRGMRPEMPEEMRREMEKRRDEMRKRMEEARAKAGEAGRGGRPQAPMAAMPPEIQERLKGMMEEGRKRMAEAQEKMEQARRRFGEMEERIKRLEAEVERLKAAK